MQSILCITQNKKNRQNLQKTRIHYIIRAVNQGVILMDRDENTHLGYDFDKLIEDANKHDSIFVPNLKKDDIVEIKTRNHIYVLKILDPRECTALVTSNGKHITEPTKAVIAGSLVSLWSTSIRSKYITMGRQLELIIDSPEPILWLSPTATISVNGVRLFPLTHNTVQ